MDTAPRRAPAGARAWAARVVLASLTLAAGLGLSEAVVRLVGPGVTGTGVGHPHPAGMYLPDAALGYRLHPGFTGTFEKESFTMTIEIDEEGFRCVSGSGAWGTRVVLVLGDSFTFGIGVEGRETFCARLGEMLDADRSDGEAFRVINAGVPGYGTTQESRLLDRILERTAPAIVILCFYPNDLLDNAIDARSRMEVDEEGLLVRRWIGEGEAPWNWASQGFVSLPLKAFLRERSALYRLLQFHFRRFVERETLPRNWAVTGAEDPMVAYERLGGDYLYLDGESDAIRALWADEFQRIDEMRRRVAAAGARFLVVLLPTDNRVYPGSRDDAARWLNLDPALFDDERVVDAFSRYAADREGDVEVLDLGPSLIGARDAGGRLYYRGDDRHFTPRGHEVAARAIGRAIAGGAEIDG